MGIKESISELRQKFDADLSEVRDSESIEKLRVSYLGKKGSVTELLKGLKDLSGAEKKEFGQFSKGMKMKLQIAAALSHGAELLVMDEATSGLDPVVRSEMLDVFLEFIADEGHSILMSSHITSDLERIADSITFIHGGKILLSDQKDVILDDHRIIKCGGDELNRIDSDDIISIRRSEFGCEVMVKNFSRNGHKYSNMITDRAALDEILLFAVKGMNSREWQI